MLAVSTERERQAFAKANRLLGSSSRYVDLAVEIVATDGDGRRRIGGRYDTLLREWVGEPANFAVWEVGQGQYDVLSQRGRVVCIGAQGAGKTEVLARWILMKAILLPGFDIGAIAPTQKRLRILWSKIAKLLRPSWVAEVRISEGEIVLVNGARLQFVATKVYSKEIGSPVQGYSWGACGIDEEQDSDDESIVDCLMRGRSAPNGFYEVFSSCTLKDTPLWRARKARYANDPGVTMIRMDATANPFVDPSYWERLKSSLTPRQWRMRVLALDARPERATYPDFERPLHVTPIPQIGVRDVTKQITGGALLVGHDPGTLQDTSVILKAYLVGNDTLPTWWVVAELVTKPGSAGRHAMELATLVQAEFGFRPTDVVMRADPYGDTETRPHVTVYREYQLLGFRIMPAVYRSNPKPNTAHLPGMLPREARIQCVNALLHNAAGVTRLYVADGGRCPELIGSLEMQERDELGKAETAKKGASDTSHAAASLGYAMYPYEHTRREQPAQKAI